MSDFPNNATSWDIGDPDELHDFCERCNARIPAGTGEIVSLSGPNLVDVDWVFCEECIDSFTAWRLTKDPAPADELADEERPF